MRSGCAWRQLPTDLPPWSTVYRWFATCRDACLFEKINHALVMVDRERIGRQASPSAAIIDSQSVKTTEAGVNKHPDQIGFTVLPRRWVVERFFSLGRTQSQARNGLRGHDRLCQSIPLRRIHHAALTPYCEGSVSFETDSQPPSREASIARAAVVRGLTEL
jgi:transposase